MKSSIGIVGHFAVGKEFYDGQTIKTKILYDELVRRIGKEQVTYMDTYNWRRNLFKILVNSFSIALTSKKIIINTSQRGRNVFIPFFGILKFILGISVYCMVIGGGFPNQMKRNNFVSKFAKKLDGVYVETNTMLEELEEMGYNNVYRMNNFKNLNIIKEKDLKYQFEPPFRICTFSRVMKKKGIDDVIKAVTHINNQENEVIYCLDIYGQIDPNYKNYFKNLEAQFPEYIKYKGVIDYDKSVDIIKNYFLLVFPTLYKTEGVPGTIIDAYSSGVPVIAYDWYSCEDVIIDKATGLICKMGNTNDLVEKLRIAYKNYREINKMKISCLKKAFEYTPNAVVNDLLQKLAL